MGRMETSIIILHQISSEDMRIGDITAPSGNIVTSWALRNYIENATGYGWTWESGTYNQTTPTVVAEIRASDGSMRLSGKLGIGVNPTYKLDVLDTGTGNGDAGIYLSKTGNTSGTSYGMYSTLTGSSTTNVAGYFTSTNATNNYAIIVPAGGGNVGIGTTTPNAPLSIQTDSSIKSLSFYGRPTANDSQIIFYENDQTTIISSIYVSNGGIYMSANGGAYQTILTPSGNFGIGTTSPDSLLTLNDGHIKVSQTTPPTIDDLGNIGSGATYTVSQATDTALIINLMPGPGCGAGAQVGITFNIPYNNPPIIVFSANNEVTSLVDMYVESPTINGFTFFAPLSLVDGQSYSWSFHIIETIA